MEKEHRAPRPRPHEQVLLPHAPQFYPPSHQEVCRPLQRAEVRGTEEGEEEGKKEDQEAGGGIPSPERQTVEVLLCDRGWGLGEGGFKCVGSKGIECECFNVKMK